MLHDIIYPSASIEPDIPSLRPTPQQPRNRTQIHHPTRTHILLLFPPQHLLPHLSSFLFSGTSSLPHQQETSLDSPALNFRPKNRKSSEIVRHEAVQEALLDQIRDDRLNPREGRGQVLVNGALDRQ
jgi:hypothetical protein